MFDLGDGFERGDAVQASFELTLSGEGAYGMGLGFAMIVPEPGTGLLLAFGLVAVGLSRRRTVR